MENQRQARMLYKTLSQAYKDALAMTVNEIDPSISYNDLKKLFKRIN